jgi:hypothetical protein
MQFFFLSQIIVLEMRIMENGRNVMWVSGCNGKWYEALFLLQNFNGESEECYRNICCIIQLVFINICSCQIYNKIKSLLHIRCISSSISNRSYNRFQQFTSGTLLRNQKLFNSFGVEDRTYRKMTVICVHFSFCWRKNYRNKIYE